MEKCWKILPLRNQDKLENLRAGLRIHDLFLQLLLNRNITDYEMAERYFRPIKEHLLNPFLMKGMAEASARIDRALKTDEKILIYGDYDVDGTTAVALMTEFLKNRMGHTALEYYIPDRATEGYGVSFAGMDYAIQHKFTLIISLDCGVKSADKVAYVKPHGIDFIICDHHLPGDTLPDAIMLNPKQPGCSYPFKELSGCGIGLKLALGLLMFRGENTDAVYDLIDLAAVSTCCDMVPLYGENRVIVSLGLTKLLIKPREGLKHVLDSANFNRTTLTVEDVVFIIGPRINAAGRLEHGKKAVELLLGGDPEFLKQAAQEIDRNNNDRKALEQEITQEACELVENEEVFTGTLSCVLYNNRWHKGVVGIVASKMVEKFYKPSIVLTESNGKITGSARSVDGFDIYAAIDACSSCLENYGGHTFAAGLTMKPENLEAFTRLFDQYVCSTIREEQRIPTLYAEAEIPIHWVGEDGFLTKLKRFAPFGNGNENPLFISRNVQLYDRRAELKSGNHLSLTFEVPGKNHLKAMAFNSGHLYPAVLKYDTMDICYSVKENEWKGRKEIQLDIKDIMFQKSN
jgi:single-stranded-DNA-specific exonuclease